MEINLTKGSILKNILRFSLPFLLSNFLQTLYGMIDLYIVGQYYDSNIITAVSMGSQIMHFVTVTIVGLTMGTTVLIGQSIGRSDYNQKINIIKSSIKLFSIISIAFTLVFVFLIPHIIYLMSTPKTSIEATQDYLFICFLGTIFITAYNVISAIYRGNGDSKSPLIFISIACLLNIILDYCFIGILHLGSKGAALATIISQAVSVFISFIGLLKYRSSNKRTKEYTNCIPSILKIGIPIALQDGFIQISFLIITKIANTRGVDMAAAVGIVEKIIGFLFLVPSSMLSSISVIASQNIGAGYRNRAKMTLAYGMSIAIISGLTFAIILQFTSTNVLQLFSKQNDQVIVFGTQYLKAYVYDCVFASIHFAFSGYFCATGKSFYSFLHNVISIVFIRIPGAILMSKLFPETLYPMGWAIAFGSIISSVICFIIYLSLERKITK